GALASAAVLAQAPAPTPAPAPPPQQGATTTPSPYKPVPITLAPALNDTTFEAFRKQLADVAQKKDRAALARLVAPNFFWIPKNTDTPDKGKQAIDNMAKALSFDGKDAVGWEALVAYAAETTATADPQRSGVFCAPAEPVFDEKAADELANTTQT